MLWLEKLKKNKLCWDEGGCLGGWLFVVRGFCLDAGEE